LGEISEVLEKKIRNLRDERLLLKVQKLVLDASTLQEFERVINEMEGQLQKISLNLSTHAVLLKAAVSLFLLFFTFHFPLFLVAF